LSPLVDVVSMLFCEGPLGRSHASDRFPPMRGGGFDVDRPREHGFGAGRPERESDDLRDRWELIFIKTYVLCVGFCLKGKGNASSFLIQAFWPELIQSVGSRPASDII